MTFLLIGAALLALFVFGDKRIAMSILRLLMRR
jgi:hypothetical protein